MSHSWVWDSYLIVVGRKLFNCIPTYCYCSDVTIFFVRKIFSAINISGRPGKTIVVRARTLSLIDANLSRSLASGSFGLLRVPLSPALSPLPLSPPTSAWPPLPTFSPSPSTPLRSRRELRTLSRSLHVSSSVSSVLCALYREKSVSRCIFVQIKLREK